MILYATSVAVFYVLIVVWKRNNFAILLSTAFVFSSIFLRLNVDPQSLKDFTPYFSSFQLVKYDAVPIHLWIEPYRLLLFRSVILFGDFNDISQIKAIYYLHFAIVTLFFLWLAWLRDVAIEIKLVLFLAFYPTIAFVWLRSGMAIVVAGYLLYTFQRGRLQALHYILPMFHITTLVLLTAKKTQDMRVFSKAVVLIVTSLLFYTVFETAYGQYILNKLERYSETSDRRTSLSLLMFHAANFLTTSYLMLISTRFRRSYLIRILSGFYMLSYFLNPVIALRIFPFVLIAAIAERGSHSRYQLFSSAIACVYFVVYFARFDQIFL